MYSRLLVAAAIFVCACVADAAELRGRVSNSRGNEPLSQVRVMIEDTRQAATTTAAGAFVIQSVPRGKHTVRVDAVGFWTQRFAVEVTQDFEVKEFEIHLVHEGLRHSESVEVTAEPFADPERTSVGQMQLTASELKDSATVLAADPLRSVQAMPGVTAANNDDFYAQFSVWGAPFHTIGVYLDDIQLRRPFHGIPGASDGASVSLVNSDTVDDLTLTPAAYGARFADATGGVLDIRTREGSRGAPRVRASLGMAETHIAAEGGLGKQNRGSWLVSGRKSYLGYLTNKSVEDPSFDVSFFDTAARLTYNLSRSQTLDVYGLHGVSELDRSDYAERLRANQLATGENEFTLARIGWRVAFNPRFLLSTRGAFIRQNYQDNNRQGDVRGREYYGEWVAGSTAIWNWGDNDVLEAGWDTRRLRQNYQSYRYYYGETYARGVDGTGVRQGGYAQQSSSILSGRMQVSGGLRWDRQSRKGEQPISPQASISYKVAPSTHVQFAFGRYAQFADVAMPEACDSESVMFDRSTHYLVAFEQGLGEHARVRVEGFHRRNVRQFGRQKLTPDGCGLERLDDRAWDRPGDYTRGMQVVLQRRSANRLAGWVAYTLAYAKVAGTDGLSGYSNPYDQRHTLNVFASYRLKPSVSASAKWLFGSGYPIPGYYRELANGAFIADFRNPGRLGPYARLDVRVNKAVAVGKTMLTIYAEVINVTNHRNMRVTGTRDFDPVSGRVYLDMERTVPFTPTAGISFEF